jgi:hypothetical protein
MEKITLPRLNSKPTLKIRYTNKEARATENIEIKLPKTMEVWRLYDFFDKRWRMENGIRGVKTITSRNSLEDDSKILTLYFRFCRTIEGRFARRGVPSKKMEESARLAQDIYNDRTLADINREIELIENAMNERLEALDKKERLDKYSSRNGWKFDSREAWERLEMTDSFNKRGILLGKAEALAEQIAELRKQEDALREQARVLEAHAMRRQAMFNNSDFSEEDLDAVFRGIAKYDPSPFVWS